MLTSSNLAPSHTIMSPKFAGKWCTLTPPQDVPSPLLSPPVVGILSRNPEAKSLSTWTGQGALKKSPKYTGTNVIGIATLHKSNAVPVFSQEAATDAARMRR